MSPCKLKFATNTYDPFGATCTVAGKLPSCTRPNSESPTVEYFHNEP